MVSCRPHRSSAPCERSWENRRSCCCRHCSGSTRATRCWSAGRSPGWRSFTALAYHFETQPLPTPLAWHAGLLPPSLLAAGTLAALLVEVGLMFFIFAPRRLRAFAGISILVLQILVTLTGNYNFFNALTMLLCLFLFDDKALRRLIRERHAERIVAAARSPERDATLIAATVALVLVPAGVARLTHLLLQAEVPLLSSVSSLIAPFNIVNHYGLFAVMTTERPEIVIEGSDDGVTWREYAFRYKPGDVMRRPRWNAPHQPRRDWPMWFLALSGDPNEAWFVELNGDPNEAWFVELLRALLENRSTVLELMAVNPFADRPPKSVRALLYDYKFADAATHAANGQWWVRTLQRELVPAITLDNLTANPR